MVQTAWRSIVTCKQRECYNPHLAPNAGLRSAGAMFSTRCFFRMVPCALFLVGAFDQVRGQSPGGDAAPASLVQPTVTPEMGDPGGKFFGQEPDPRRTRHYYIAAEPELWNFAPEGQDPVCGKAFPSSL